MTKLTKLQAIQDLSALVRDALRQVMDERYARKTDVAAPAFKLIEEYTSGELDAAIVRAEEQEGKECFWRLVNGVDAFFERRRRERGYGFQRGQADTWNR